jgi:hypothetical protein
VQSNSQLRARVSSLEQQLQRQTQTAGELEYVTGGWLCSDELLCHIVLVCG